MTLNVYLFLENQSSNKLSERKYVVLLSHTDLASKNIFLEIAQFSPNLTRGMNTLFENYLEKSHLDFLKMFLFSTVKVFSV